MSVREYIGARYVPLFMGQWDNTKTYEPLSIVINEGNSYTSRQYVPTGIEITNSHYWALTGNYNAQVEQYRQEVATLEGNIETIGNIIPSTDFTSESTVKDAIDDINAIIPSTDFTSESTVKDAIDGINAIIPSTDFTSESTVKDAIDNVQTQITNIYTYEKVNAMNPPNNLNPLTPNDNTYDNSADFQAILEYCIANKKTMFIPSGSYYFDTPISIEAGTDVYIEGEDWNACFLMYTGTGTFLTFSPSTGRTNINYAHLRNFNIEGNVTNNFIKVYNAQNWYFECIHANDFAKAFVLDNSNNVKTGNCYFNKCSSYSATTDGVGFYINGQNVSTYFYNCFASFAVGGSNTTAVGFMVDCANVISDVSFVSCETANGYIGFYIKGSSSDLLNNDIRLIGCCCDGSTYGIREKYVYNSIISDCHLNISNVSSATGIVIDDDCDQIIIANNTIIHMASATNNKYGIGCYESSAVITGNTFINLGTAISSECSTQTNKTLNINGNTIFNETQSCNGFYIIGNNFSTVIINGNLFKTTKKDYDIYCTAPKTIITNNSIADIDANSGTGSITDNNISR